MGSLHLTILDVSPIINNISVMPARKIVFLKLYIHIEGDIMNKLELIDMLKNECRLSKKEAAAIVDLFFDSMSEALAKGDRVEVRGLCSLYIKEYQSYNGRNPKTGEIVQVTPKKLPFFKCGKELKDRVDY